MRRRVARTIDHLNAGLVRWRIGARQPEVDPARLQDYLASLPSDPLAAAGLAMLRPAPVESHGRREVWRTSQSDWVATRWRPRSADSSGALVFLHGWLATPLHLRLMRLAVGGLLRRGVEVWLPRLPAHMERTPAGAVSGGHCLSADLVATGKAVALAVEETCGLASWLRHSGHRRVGVWGISLGGWVAALASTVRDDWDAAALWTPVVDPVEALNHSPLTESIRSRLDASAVNSAASERVLRGFAAIHRRALLPAARVLVIAGRYDNVVSVESIETLGANWGVDPVWAPHGHISVLGAANVRSRCTDFLATRLARNG